MTRALAFAVDAAVLNGVAVLAAAVVTLALSVVSVGDDLEAVLVALGGAAYLVWTVAYFATFWSTTGQTPGGRLLRFRVEDGRTGAALRPGRAVLRFAGVLLAALPLFAGFLPILTDDRRRGLHDRIAGSVVVDAGSR